MPTPVKHTISIANAHDEPIATLDVVEAYSARYIVNVWVHPDEQQQGYASDLLRSAVATFGQHDLYLHALPYADRPLNEVDLCAFYARFGFQPIPAFPGGMYRLATKE